MNDFLEEEIYVNQPPGYVKKDTENKMYHLKKASYGLKQAPIAWYSHIDGYFLKKILKSVRHTLYIKEGDQDKFFMLFLYVDDLIFTAIIQTYMMNSRGL